MPSTAPPTPETDREERVPATQRSPPGGAVAAQLVPATRDHEDGGMTLPNAGDPATIVGRVTLGIDDPSVTRQYGTVEATHDAWVLSKTTMDPRDKLIITRAGTRVPLEITESEPRMIRAGDQVSIAVTGHEAHDFYVRGHDGDGDRIQAHTGTAKGKGGGRASGKGKRRGREARQQQARGRGGARRVTFKRARRG